MTVVNKSPGVIEGRAAGYKGDAAKHGGQHKHGPPLCERVHDCEEAGENATHGKGVPAAKPCGVGECLAKSRGGGETKNKGQASSQQKRASSQQNEPAARNESGEGLRSPECEMVHFIPSKLVNMIWVVTFQAKPNDKRGPRSLSKQQGERRKSKARKVNKSVRACVCWGWCVSFPHLLSHSLTNAQTDTHAPGKRWMTPPRSSRSNACTPSLWKSKSGFVVVWVVFCLFVLQAKYGEFADSFAQ